MNLRALGRSVCLGLVLVSITVWLTACAGAGPAASPGSGRPRCGSRSGDDQRPLFYIFCVESP